MLKFKGKHIMVLLLPSLLPLHAPMPPLCAQTASITIIKTTICFPLRAQLDCGIHPAYTGLAALPYFDMIDDPATIDLLLVSQYTYALTLEPPPPNLCLSERVPADAMLSCDTHSFHLDHCASLPYFMEKVSSSLPSPREL
jgi:Cft2 family RNA processing exonuclease